MDVLFEPEDRSEGHNTQHSSVLSGDLEGLPVYNVVGQNLLREYFPSSLDGLIVGSIQRGEQSSFRIFFEGTRLSDVEVIPGHVVSIQSSGSNQQEDAPFLPPVQHLRGGWFSQIVGFLFKNDMLYARLEYNISDAMAAFVDNYEPAPARHAHNERLANESGISKKLFLKDIDDFWKKENICEQIETTAPAPDVEVKKSPPRRRAG